MGDPVNNTDMFELVCYTNQKKADCSRNLKRLAKLMEKADVIQARLNDMGRQMTSELWMLKKQRHRYAEIQHGAQEFAKGCQLWVSAKKLEFPVMPPDSTGMGW